MRFLSSLFRRKPTAQSTKGDNINISTDRIEYVPNPTGCTVITADEFDFVDIKRMYYRVIIHAEDTDENLIRIFKGLDKAKYEVVKVWFYNSIDEIRQNLPYTVAMLERKKKSPIRIIR